MEENRKILYVGVSPKPFRGLGYWYVDESGKTQPNSYVWARMGRHNTEQIVYVDCTLWCTGGDEPYPYERTRRILRQTTPEEGAAAAQTWQEEE